MGLQTALDRDTDCASCGNHIPAADVDVRPRIPCRACGATARIFRVSITERLGVSDSFGGERVELSAETSASAVAIISMPDMTDFWREAAMLKEAMLRDSGSDVALRAIARGAFDPNGQYPFDDKTKTKTQFVAEEILREREAAAARLRDDSLEAGERRRDALNWIDRLLAFVRGS